MPIFRFINLLCVLVLLGCSGHPVDIVRDKTNEPNIMAFHWNVTSQEVIQAQYTFPQLGGVLFEKEYNHAQYLNKWVAIYQNNGAKLKNTIELYGEPEYIILGTDEPNTGDHTPYLTPKDFAIQLNQGLKDLKSLGFDSIPIVSAGLAPKDGDFDWAYWYEVEKHFDVSKLNAIAYNANKTSVEKIEIFIGYFAESSQTVVLQPAPFNDTLNRATSGSEHIRTFFRFSQRSEVLSVNIWNLYDKSESVAEGLFEGFGLLSYSGTELKDFYDIEAPSAQ